MSTLTVSVSGAVTIDAAVAVVAVVVFEVSLILLREVFGAMGVTDICFDVVVVVGGSDAAVDTVA